MEKGEIAHFGVISPEIAHFNQSSKFLCTVFKAFPDNKMEFSECLKVKRCFKRT